MKRQVWSLDEIRDVLVAINEANGVPLALLTEPSSQQVEVVRAYRQGFRAALAAMSRALGLSLLPASLDLGGVERDSRSLSLAGETNL